MDLTSIRKEIDQIDQDIIHLLEKRMDLVSNVVGYKRQTKTPVLDDSREEKILNIVASSVSNQDYSETIVNIFRDILKQSRNYQKGKLE